MKRNLILTAALVMATAGMAGAQCADPTNILSADNCGFDTAASVGVGAWAPNTDGLTNFGTVAHAATGGQTSPGTMESTPAVNGGGQSATYWGGADYCFSNFPVNAGDSYGFGGYAFVTSGTVDVCRTYLAVYASTDCTGGGAVTEVTGNTAFSPASGVWLKINAADTIFTAGAGDIGNSMGLRLACSQFGFMGPFTANFDDAYVGPAMVPVELQSFSIE